MSAAYHQPDPVTSPDLEERFALIELAQALADVDEPGCWWTLGPRARGRYEAMATVAIDLLGDRELNDEEWERARHYGLREALARIDSVVRVWCLDCDEDTIQLGEYYSLRDEVWLEANPDDRGMLCIGCVEERLGRQLQPADFTDAPINGCAGSSRLRSRLGLEAAT